MKTLSKTAAFGLAATLATTSASAQMVGNYTRNSDDGLQTIVVQVVDSKL